MNNMKETLKIAVFHNLPSGGAKRALHDHVKYLASSGHEVDVFVPETANETFLPLKEIVDNFKIFPLKTDFLRSWLYHRLDHKAPGTTRISIKALESVQKDIADVINGENYDIALSEQDRFTMSPFFLKYIKIPTAYYCQQPLRNDKILEKISNDATKSFNFIRNTLNYRNLNNTFKIDRKNAKYAHYIMANSYFSREEILKTYGLNSFVSYLGIDTDMFKPLDLSEDFLLAVGSCTPTKGYDFTVRSLALIDKQIRPKFIIISNHSPLNWVNHIKNLANKLDVELKVLDRINDKELIELYNKAKMVIYAPYLEPFGLIPIESMSCGTPVVAVKEGGVRETVIHNKTGMLIDRDEGLFAQAILELLMDDAKRNRISRKAVKTAKNSWDIEHAGNRLLNHLNRAINTYTSLKS